MWLLIILFFVHFLADFTHLSTQEMLAAKRVGKPLFPIFNHAAIHGTMMGFVIVLYLKGGIHTIKIILFTILFETATHFVIDLLKGKLNVWFPKLQSPANKFHWYVFGFDQFLHATVIIFIVHFIQTNQ